MNFLNACFILAFIVSTNAIFDNVLIQADSINWNTLRVTFGINFLSKWTFAELPLTKDEALKADFKLIGDECSGLFKGYRYLKESDPAVILLFDAKGNVAGIQTSFAESKIPTEKAKNWYKQQPMFTVEHLPLNKSDNFYTLTAYLTNPDDICTSGRSPEDVKNNPSGSDLYLKNGTIHTLIPKNQSDVATTNWTLGKCFPLMGVHYWYDLHKDMNCNYFQPYFLLYNRKKLTGFGFAAYGYFNSKRYEHPDKPVLSTFMKVVPDCLNEIADDIGPFSTIHVYMNFQSWNLLC